VHLIGGVPSKLKSTSQSPHRVPAPSRIAVKRSITKLGGRMLLQALGTIHNEPPRGRIIWEGGTLFWEGAVFGRGVCPFVFCMLI